MSDSRHDENPLRKTRRSEPAELLDRFEVALRGEGPGGPAELRALIDELRGALDRTCECPADHTVEPAQRREVASGGAAGSRERALMARLRIAEDENDRLEEELCALRGAVGDMLGYHDQDCVRWCEVDDGPPRTDEPWMF